MTNEAGLEFETIKSETICKSEISKTSMSERQAALDALDDLAIWSLSNKENMHLVYDRSKTIRAALSSPATQPIDAWLPIETAPKDKDILVYCKETGELFVVFWAFQIDTRKGDWVIARANDGTCFICKNPTHWMSLPKPPEGR